jgi:hypothetical protein
MKIFIKAIIAALIIELVSGGLLLLGPGEYLDRLHLGVLEVPAMILHIPSFLFTKCICSDSFVKMHWDIYAGILVSAQWLVWVVIVYTFLFFRERRSQKAVV